MQKPTNSSESDFPARMGRPATNALAHVGIFRLEQLTAYTEAEILKLHGVGPKAVRVLRAELAAKGLSFAEVKKNRE